MDYSEGWNNKLIHEDENTKRAYCVFCCKMPESRWNKNTYRIVIELSYYYRKQKTKWMSQTVEPYIRCDLKFTGFQNMPEHTIHASKFLEHYTLDKCQSKAISLLKVKLNEINTTINRYVLKDGKSEQVPCELSIVRNIWRRAYLDSEEDHVKILKEYAKSKSDGGN